MGIILMLLCCSSLSLYAQTNWDGLFFDDASGPDIIFNADYDSFVPEGLTSKDYDLSDNYIQPQEETSLEKVKRLMNSAHDMYLKIIQAQSADVPDDFIVRQCENAESLYIQARNLFKKQKNNKQAKIALQGAINCLQKALNLYKKENNVQKVLDISKKLQFLKG